MRRNINNKTINCLGELKDTAAEEEFLSHEFNKQSNNIKIIILGLGALSILFIVPDYFLITNRDCFNLIFAVRISFVILIIVLLGCLKYIKDFRIFSYCISICEIIYIMIFNFVLLMYENPDYLIQAFGVIIIIIAIFMVPNRLMYMVLLSCFAVVLFNIVSFHIFVDMGMSKFSAGVAYLSIVNILCMVMLSRESCYKRINFIINKEIIELSTRDSLTGMYNRAKFNNELDKYIDFSKRFNTPLSLAIIDLDDFKKVNDSYGHLCGDNLIIDFARLIMSNIRESDITARWGGEEFAVIMPDTNICQALIVADMLRAVVENNNFINVGRITCSIGVAEVNDFDGIDSILYRADQKMYEAKKFGKNAVRG